MKKFLSVMLVLAMLMTSVIALGEGAFTPADSYDPGERTFDGGVIATELSEGGSSGEINTVRYAGDTTKDYTDEKEYTYNTFITDMGSGLDWNPHTWETSDDSIILDYTTTGFYAFRANENVDGYAVTCEMAADYPVDVTAEYAGSFSIEEGDEGKAWRIALNPDACWEDGTPITADDYIYSMQEQLNPLMLNRRADSYYNGTFNIYNAKNYLYAGGAVYNALEYATATEAIEAGEDVYVDMWNFWGLQGCVDEEGNECPQYVSINDETKYRDIAVAEGEDGDWISAKEMFDGYFAAGAPYESYAPDYLTVASVSTAVTWDEVGLKKVDDYTIDIILEDEIAEAAFYLPYNMSGNWLVYKPLYEACKTYYDANGTEIAKDEEGNIPEDAEVDSISTNYCTSLETSIGFGPYKLTYYEMDKQFTLERNENWFGYKDGKHTGMYQTDRIVYQIIGDQETQLMTFLAGEIDSVGLTAADMEQYGSSEYIIYEPQTYTTKLTFNLLYDKLLEHGTNSQILVIDEFRKAFALCLDREEFATSFTAAHQAGYGLVNYNYVYDPFSGALFRDSEGAKEALVNVYGLTYGDDGEYATLDEAYAALTGYDMEQANELMKVAYDKAIEAGIWDGESPITIEFEVYQNDTVYVQMFTYIDEQLKKACEGTGFEGKISLTMVADPDYYDTMYSGGTDMIFTTWGGSAFDPFSFMAQVYCDAADGSGNQMEIGFDTTAVSVSMNVNDVDVTASLHDWANWCNNDNTVTGIIDKIGKFADYSYATRCAIYAKLEECYLSFYATTPIYYRYVASLVSQKVNELTDTYLQLVGFGGIEFRTYNYDDAEWADYIASGELKY